jgi:cytoskeletal protein CcmA (bactofilin family)
LFSKKTEKLESFIGLNSDFRGDLNIKGELRIDGFINGLVKADSVVLGEKATVKGDITAKKIIVEGKVEGNLKAKEIVEIKSTGKVLGEIFTNKLSIMEGGVLNGKVETKVDESKVPEFDPKTQI